MHKLIIIFCYLFVISACVKPDTIIDKFEQRHLASLEGPDGRDYQERAVREFLLKPVFMETCVPADEPEQPPLTIYFEVTSDGYLGQLYFSKTNPVTECISAHVKGKIFTRPEKNFFAKIELNFLK